MDSNKNSVQSMNFSDQIQSSGEIKPSKRRSEENDCISGKLIKDNNQNSIRKSSSSKKELSAENHEATQILCDMNTEHFKKARRKLNKNNVSESYRRTESYSSQESVSDTKK